MSILMAFSLSLEKQTLEGDAGRSKTCRTSTLDGPQMVAAFLLCEAT